MILFRCVCRDMFKKLLDDKNYLSTDKMRRHMISIVQKATNKFKVGSELVFNANSNGTNYQLKVSLIFWEFWKLIRIK